MTLYQLLVGLHVSLGAIALVSFWWSAAQRKGSGGHRTGGKTYLIAMLGVLGTAIPLSIAAFAQGKPVTGTFLAYLVVITITPAWTAWRAIRDQRSIARYVGPVFRALAWGNLAAGAVVLALGIRFQVTLLIGMAFVGLVTGPLMLRFARREVHERRWWLAQHFSGMIGAGVATHVAFFGLGLARVLPPALAAWSQNLAFFVPVIVALFARVWLARKYGVGQSLPRPSTGTAAAHRPLHSSIVATPEG